MTNPYIFTLLSFIEIISSYKSRNKFRLFKNLVNPVFILSSILRSESFSSKNVIVSVELNLKSFVMNVNTQEIVVKFVDRWVMFAIDWYLIYRMYKNLI